jgi:3-hydroxyacyl-CoA dehydrogenase/enoyl-CoA hydratase/3-hydroxybutyryl-CoA epimerase
MVGQTTKNMITAFFFNLNAIKAGQSRPSGFATWKPAKVGILGAGMMGAGIALASAKKSIPCVLLDIDLKKAQLAQVLPLIHATDKLSDLQGCDLVIEAVFENRDLKAQVTRDVESVMLAGGVFASNTSTLPISGLAKASVRPAKFVGLHFFSPVDKMRLVEIIKGVQTDDETLARAYDYVLAIGKTPIVVNDSRGFFTSRVFGTYVMEGAAMLSEGIPAALIEHAAVAAGMPVGPLAVMDETSLSLSVHVIEQTRADFAAEGKTYVSSVGEKMVEGMVQEFKRPGRAAGAGFYDYPSAGPKRLWSGLKQHFEKPLAGDPQALQLVIKQRLLYRQAVETARCLQENVLTSAHDANIGSIFGIGFPAWTGGALQFVFSEGLETFFTNCRQLAQQYGQGFDLSPEVIDCLKKHRL